MDLISMRFFNQIGIDVGMGAEQIEPLYQYFTAEKKAGWCLIALFVCAVVTCAYLWFTKDPYIIMGVPLLLIGFVQLFVGLRMIRRTDAQMSAIFRGLCNTPKETILSEQERMLTVMNTFKHLKVAETILLLAALLLITFVSPPIIEGIAWGVLIQASLMLLFDTFAERRAYVYKEWLSQVTYCSKHGIRCTECTNLITTVNSAKPVVASQ
jgi:hypothetical protein